MIEIIYLDIDGTLRDEQSGIPASAVEAILQCREKGIHIVICTGRNLSSVQDDVKQIPMDGIISGDGAYIWFHNQKIAKRCFPVQVLEQVFKVSQQQELFLSLEAEQGIYMEQKAAVFYQHDFTQKIDCTSAQDIGEVIKQNKILYRDNADDVWQEIKSIHKICFWGTRAGITKAIQYLGNEIEIIQNKRWNGIWYLEVLPKGCSKGSAVTKLNQKLHIPKRKSMSFGDSENDIPMMKATGISVAVGHTCSSLYPYIDSVCEPVMEDGIYKELLRRNIIERRI